MSILRVSFRLAGMHAEVIHLARESFTGEVRYWHDGEELRRTMKHIVTGVDIALYAPNLECVEKNAAAAEACLKKMDAWCVARDGGDLKLFFSHGQIKRMEF